ncbi:MAG: peptidylprolyl isomerase [Phycisphaerae bacterium]
MVLRSVFLGFGLLLSGLAAAGPGDSAIPGIRAHLQPKSYFVPVGSPVWMQFSLENTTGEPITLTVPGTEPDIPAPEMGLPLSHVFSGRAGRGVTVTTESSQRWDRPLSYKAPTSAPILMIAPHSTVGTTIDLRDYFPSFRSAGEFRVSWSPYGGEALSKTATISITPLKQVEIHTDDGVMTVELFYADAPNTVANFLELASSHFYDGTTFHRVEPGYFAQGGCPRGDGTGIRPDGKRVAAELNAHAHEKGTLSMALLDDDPESASCQFFICNTRQKEWDGRYTVFGRLVGESSLRALDKIMAAEVDESSRPLETIYMRSLRVVDAPKGAPSGSN